MNAFAERIKNFFSFGKTISEEVFEDLTDLLVEGDFGAAEAYRISDKLMGLCKKEKITDSGEAKKLLAKLLEEMLCRGKTPLDPFELPGSNGSADSDSKTKGLLVMLLLGVNGVGKTTSAAKLASRGLGLGRRPILAAADTFRAAAIDQIKIHGDRLGVRVVAHQHGGDPAAVIYDALEAAKAGGADLIIADTAGRMHTRASLVEELKKIDRVVESRAAGCCYLKYLVLDATTGRNALAQAETFHEAVTLDGIILTKFDSSARGGVVFSLAEELGLPVIFLCTGEKYGDIALFNPRSYAEEFAGLG